VVLVSALAWALVGCAVQLVVQILSERSVELPARASAPR
jgi:hypothetical protein